MIRTSITAEKRLHALARFLSLFCSISWLILPLFRSDPPWNDPKLPHEPTSTLSSS